MSTIVRILVGGELRRAADAALLLWRAAIGAFLVWGVSDNLASAEHMAQFAGFLQSHGFPYPAVLAPVSVWAQALCGAAFILGGLTRVAGMVCAFNFAVALAMVDAELGVRPAFPAFMLLCFGVYIALRGPGRFSIDAQLCKGKSAASDASDGTV